ncbi:MAG: hypothetical protein ACREGK_00335, partial [Geminicoccales bacterium]
MGIIDRESRTAGARCRMQIDGLRVASTVLAAAIALWLAASTAAFGDNLATMTVDAIFNIRDQAYEVANKSRKGVIEAMKEFESSSDLPNENPGSYLLRKYAGYDQLAKLNQTLSKDQLRLFKIDQALLKKLPPGDSRRAGIVKELGNLPIQNQEVSNKTAEFGKSRKEFNDEIQKYK